MNSLLLYFRAADSCDSTCDNSSTQVEVQDARGKRGQNHPRRGKESTDNHHRSTTELVHQHATQRSLETHNKDSHTQGNKKGC